MVTERKYNKWLFQKKCWPAAQMVQKLSLNSNFNQYSILAIEMC